MKKTLILVSLLSLGMAASTGAMAKSDKHHDRGHDRGDYRNDHRDDHRRHDRHNNRHDNRRNSHDNGWHGERERRWTGDRYRINVYQAPRGYVRHHWRYGDRVPAGYRNSRYVVHDYRSYRLQAPPRNHHWLRVDNDVVLTAVTTGVVAAVVYGIFQ